MGGGVGGLLGRAAVPIGEVGLEPKNGTELPGPGLGVETPGGVQVAVVGDREGRLFELLRSSDQVIDPVGTVEKRVLGVAMKVHEGHRAKDSEPAGFGQKP